MNFELNLVKEFHEKFDVPILVEPFLIPDERSSLRYKLIKEEVEEYQKGVENNDLNNIAKELADILYSTYGTILEHGLQDKIKNVFLEVHKSNMSKEFSNLKMIKGESYFDANINKILNG